MPTTHRAAVPGDPIDHSHSPVIHNAGYRAAGMDDWHYDRIHCNAKELADVVDGADPSLQRFPVTMPGKFVAPGLANEVSERVWPIGSANTLVRRDSGWSADNTDGDGILGVLREIDCTNAPCGRAVVVGVGGTTRSAFWALSQLGVSHVTVVARSERAYDIEPLAAALGTESVWVISDVPNPTDIAGNADVPVSMVPSAAVESVVGYLVRAPKILDVIYNPWPTLFVKAAKRGGTRAVGGLFTSLHQAVGQFEQFTGRILDTEMMCAALPKQLTLVTTPQLWDGK